MSSTVLARAVAGIEMKELKSLADEGKKQVGSGIVAIVSVNDEGKAGLEDLRAVFSAGAGTATDAPD